MTTEAFEMLISDWLDQPHNADLRATIDRAIAQNASLAPIFESWMRCAAAMRTLGPVDNRLDETRLYQEIRRAVSASVDRELNDAALDRALAQTPRADLRVDWARLSSRIRAAIDSDIEQTLQPGPLDRILRRAGDSSPKVDWRLQRARLDAHLAPIHEPRAKKSTRRMAISILAIAAAAPLLAVLPRAFRGAAETSTQNLAAQVECVIDDELAPTDVDASITLAVFAPSDSEAISDDDHDEMPPDVEVASASDDDLYFSIDAGPVAVAEPPAGM